MLSRDPKKREGTMTPDQSTVARYVGWGRGKWHIERDESGQTVCGRDLPEDARTTIYNPVVCARCKKDEEAVALAERARKDLWEQQDLIEQNALDRNRDGEFVVYRCKTCGRQHAGRGRGPGVPFCMREGHPADLEVVEVKGPKWVAA